MARPNRRQRAMDHARERRAAREMGYTDDFVGPAAIRDEDQERRRRDDQRHDREREWRQWDRREAAWSRGLPASVADQRVDRSDRERSSREREWHAYDEGRQREYEQRQRAFWSPYEMEEHAYPARTTGTENVHPRSGWGRGPKGYRRSDERINEDVCERLTDAPLDASEIEVAVSNGEVTLAGTVQERWEKRQAEDLADGVRGVHEVHNRLRVTRT